MFTLKINLFLEGPDGSGKSTLGEKLIAKGFPTLIHSGGPPKDNTEFLNRLDVLCQAEIYHKPQFRDRCTAISELVYPEALGNRGTIIPKSIIGVWLSTMRPYIIYCCPPDEIIMNNPVPVKPHKPPEFVEQVKQSRRKILDRYKLVMEDLPLLYDDNAHRIIHYDYTNDPYADKLFQQLISQKDLLCVE